MRKNLIRCLIFLIIILFAFSSCEFENYSGLENEKDSTINNEFDSIIESTDSINEYSNNTYLLYGYNVDADLESPGYADTDAKYARSMDSATTIRHTK